MVALVVCGFYTSSVAKGDTFLASARSHCGSNTPRVLFTTTVTLRYPLEKAIVGVVISPSLKKYEAKAYLKSLLQWEKGDRLRWMRCKNQTTPTKKGDHWSPFLYHPCHSKDFIVEKDFIQQQLDFTEAMPRFHCKATLVALLISPYNRTV